MIAWMKALHIVTLSIWSAGLVVLPLMLLQRQNAEGPIYGLQRATRFLFVTVVSPAAFIAIGTGTVLIFARETFTLWFAIKLLLVGIMAKLHVRTGEAVIEVFKEEGTFPAWKASLSVVLACVLVTGILGVVLAKPDGPGASVETEWFRPGALGEMLGFAPQLSSVMTMPTP